MCSAKGRARHSQTLTSPSQPQSHFSPGTVDCLETFRMVSQTPAESLGAYVISMARQPSDVLAVKLLMKEFGLKRYGEVVRVGVEWRVSE